MDTQMESEEINMIINQSYHNGVKEERSRIHNIIEIFKDDIAEGRVDEVFMNNGFQALCKLQSKINEQEDSNG